MKKTLIAGLLCALVMVLAAGAVLWACSRPLAHFPDTLGSDDAVPEKITGIALTEAAAKESDTLFIFGSSELKTSDICSHPANFFADKRLGFQVNLVGRGSCQSLVHALAIAANADALRGRQAVLITAPQSYVPQGIAPDLFMANFSELQVLTVLQNEDLSPEIRQYLARRVADLTDRYNADYDANLQAHTAAGLLTRAAADGKGAGWLTPYVALSQALLSGRDALHARQLAKDYADVTPEPRPIDWAAEEEAALAQAAEMVTNNDYFMQDGYYDTYIGRRIGQQADKDADLRLDQSPEYGDLEVLLDICQALDMDILFVHVPLHGSWSDYTGLTADRRQAYYEKVAAVTAKYDNVTLLDLTSREYEPYFLCDTMHLGWKGWLAVDQAIADFVR